MKKIFALILCFLMTFSLGFAALAADAPGAELRSAADGLDLSYDAGSNTSAVKELHAKGVRLFDTGGFLGAEDKNNLELVLQGVADRTGFDVGIITSNGLGGCSDPEDYADLLFYEGSFGTGSEKDGTILIVSMPANGDNDVHIYTHGIVNRYITDKGQDYIYDDLQGGMISKLSNGDFAGAFAVYAQGVLDCYEAGISEDQHNYDTQTGQTDYYYPQEPVKKHISPLEALIAAVMSALSGFAPVQRIKRQYAMESEKRMAEGFNLAYRANSNYNISRGAEAQLLRTYVKSMPIPRQTNNNDRRGSSFNSGRTTVSHGRGGSVHGGSGRKF